MPQGSRPRSWKRPDSDFAYTAAFLKLRVCERMGMRPSEFDEQTPGMQRLLMDYDTVRASDERIERKELASLIASLM